MRFTINGRLDGLNEYTKACRGNKYGGNQMKLRNQRIVKNSALEAILKKELSAPRKFPVTLRINWIEKDRRRDVDNIQFGAKFILDALVNLDILPNDNRDYVVAIENTVTTDKLNPRIEVEIKENE